MAESARRRNVPPALTATASGRSIRRRKEGAAGGGDKTGGRMEHRCHVWMAFNLQAARREMGSSRKRERERERRVEGRLSPRGGESTAAQLTVRESH